MSHPQCDIVIICVSCTHKPFFGFYLHIIVSINRSFVLTVVATVAATVAATFYADCRVQLTFFKQGNPSVEVLDGEEGILFVHQADGRATGDAFVLFPSDDDVSKALTKHKQCIGTRYIELFKSTTAEVLQVRRSYSALQFVQAPGPLDLACGIGKYTYIAH